MVVFPERLSDLKHSIGDLVLARNVLDFNLAIDIKEGLSQIFKGLFFLYTKDMVR